MSFLRADLLRPTCGQPRPNGKDRIFFHFVPLISFIKRVYSNKVRRVLHGKLVLAALNLIAAVSLQDSLELMKYVKNRIFRPNGCLADVQDSDLWLDIILDPSSAKYEEENNLAWSLFLGDRSP